MSSPQILMLSILICICLSIVEEMGKRKRKPSEKAVKSIKGPVPPIVPFSIGFMIPFLILLLAVSINQSLETGSWNVTNQLAQKHL